MVAVMEGELTITGTTVKILQKGQVAVILFPVSLIHYPQLRTHLPIKHLYLAFNTYLIDRIFYYENYYSQLY